MVRKTDLASAPIDRPAEADADRKDAMFVGVVVDRLGNLFADASATRLFVDLEPAPIDDVRMDVAQDHLQLGAADLNAYIERLVQSPAD